MSALARNTAWLTLAKGVNVALYGVFGLALPAFANEQTNGLYTLLSTLLFFGGMAASFGIPPILVRKVAQEPSSAARVYVQARAAMVAGALLAGFGILGWMSLEALWAIGGTLTTLGLLAVLALTGILLADASASAAESLFQAREEMGYPARVEVMTGALRVAGASMALILLGDESIVPIFWIFCAGSALRSWIVSRAARKRFLPAQLPATTPGDVLLLFKESLGVALFRALRMLRNRIDILLLGIFLADSGPVDPDLVAAGRGFYGQAMRVLLLFHVLTFAVNTAVFPRLARHGGADADLAAARKPFFQVVRYQAWWAAPLAAWLFVYAPDIAGWFGPTYRDGITGLQGSTASVLQVLVFAFLLDSIGGPVAPLLIGRRDMDKTLPRLGLALAVTSVLLNVLLIPRYGLLGAAYASVGASVVEILIKSYYTQKLLGQASRLLTTSLPFLLLAAGAGVGLAYGPFDTQPLLGASIAAVAYCMITAVTRLADPRMVLRAAADES